MVDFNIYEDPKKKKGNPPWKQGEGIEISGYDYKKNNEKKKKDVDKKTSSSSTTSTNANVVKNNTEKVLV